MESISPCKIESSRQAAAVTDAEDSAKTSVSAALTLSSNLDVSHVAAVAGLEAAADAVSDAGTACNAAKTSGHLHPAAVEASDAELAAAALTDAENSANPPEVSQLMRPSSLDIFCRFRSRPSTVISISRAVQISQR